MAFLLVGLFSTANSIREILHVQGTMPMMADQHTFSTSPTVDIPVLLEDIKQIFQDGLLSDENIQQAMAVIPIPMSNKTKDAVRKMLNNVDMVVFLMEPTLQRMTEGQLQNLSNAVDKAKAGETGLVEVGEEIMHDIATVFVESSSEPHFVNTMSTQVVEAQTKHSGDSDEQFLEDLLAGLLPDEFAGLAPHLLRFMNLNGSTVMEDLDLLKDGSRKSEKFPMDGRLRMLVFGANLLGLYTMMTPISTEGNTTTHQAFDVLNAQFTIQTKKWWVNFGVLQGLDIFLGLLHLRRTKLQLVQHDLGEGLLSIVGLHVESTRPLDKHRRVHVRAVNAGSLTKDGLNQDIASGALLAKAESMQRKWQTRDAAEANDGQSAALVEQDPVETEATITEADIPMEEITDAEAAQAPAPFGAFTGLMNDFLLNLALYESSIKSTMGYTSAFSLSFSLLKTRFGRWLAPMFGVNVTQYDINGVSYATEQKTLRKKLMHGIEDLVGGTRHHKEDPSIIELYTGYSMGGAIAQLLAMEEKMQCEERKETCNVVALTLNAPGMTKVSREIGLNSFWTWLYKKAHLFTGIVNFVMQHDPIARLDEPLPGANMCMFTHTAEKLSCRGYFDVSDTYDQVWSAARYCYLAKFWQVIPDNFEYGGRSACAIRKVTPGIQCMLQEHLMLIPRDADSFELNISNPLQGINFTNVLMGFLTTFEAVGRVDFRHRKDLEKSTGKTFTKPLSPSEQKKRDQERKSKYAEIDGWVEKELHPQLGAVAEKEDARIAEGFAKLPTCSGCTYSWCATQNIKEKRCCFGGFRGICSDKSKSVCKGKKQSESCYGDQGVLKGPRGLWKNRGMKCACQYGTCWDGTACASDGHHETRLELEKAQKANDVFKASVEKLKIYIRDEKRSQWEAKVVKKVRWPRWLLKDKDAKPDPTMENRWSCSF